MEMLEILKSRLPEGLEIVKVHDRTGRSQSKILFSYEGHEQIGYLNKTCTPGHAENVCDFSICTVMIGFALEQNNLESAKYWMDRQMGLTKLI